MNGRSFATLTGYKIYQKVNANWKKSCPKEGSFGQFVISPGKNPLYPLNAKELETIPSADSETQLGGPGKRGKKNFLKVSIEGGEGGSHIS